MDVRYETDELAKIEVYGTETHSQARLKNLSYGGAFFMFSDPVNLENGDLVRVTIYLDSLNKRYSINGEVRWIESQDDQSGFGIEFISYDKVFNKLIERAEKQDH